jgi:AraC family transcriptional activator of pobA
LPAYALYGEAGGALADRLHCESIAERSRLHGWEIRPHRHVALCQFLVIERGEVLARLDGQVQKLAGRAVITVPALAVHGFAFTPDIQGTVITVAEPHLLALLQPHPGLGAAVLGLRGAALPQRGAQAPAAREMLAAAAALRDECAGHGCWRAAALDAALLRLTAGLARVLPAAPLAAPALGPAAAPRALAHVQGLRALVEAQYRRQPSQAALAAQLGITPTQLNRACQQVLGRPAQAVLQARLLLQAQRELAYTGLSIKQIAFELGYTDAAYFTRVFKRMTACTPAQWRALQSARVAGVAAI